MLQFRMQSWFNAGMKTTEAINEFGSVRKLALALGVSVQAIYKWGDAVPPLRAYQIRELVQARTEGQDQHQKAA